MSWSFGRINPSSQGLDCDNPSGRGGALRAGVKGDTTATIPIASTLLVIPARSLGLGGLKARRRHGLCLLGAERNRILVPGVIFDRFQGGAVAPGAASIHLTDAQRKVQGGLGLSCNSLLDGLLPSIFLTTFLRGLGTDGEV